MCEQIFHILGTNSVTSPTTSSSDENVRCRTRCMSLVTLVLGLLSAGALAIATAVNYWIFTDEPLIIKETRDVNATILFYHFNAGLWQGCFNYEERKYLLMTFSVRLL